MELRHFTNCFKIRNRNGVPMNLQINQKNQVGPNNSFLIKLTRTFYLQSSWKNQVKSINIQSRYLITLINIFRFGIGNRKCPWQGTEDNTWGLGIHQYLFSKERWGPTYATHWGCHGDWEKTISLLAEAGDGKAIISGVGALGVLRSWASSFWTLGSCFKNGYLCVLLL